MAVEKLCCLLPAAARTPFGATERSRHSSLRSAVLRRPRSITGAQLSDCLQQIAMLLAVQAPIFGVLFALLTTLPAPALAAPARKNVLFIYSFSKRDTFDSLEQLKSVIRNHA